MWYFPALQVRVKHFAPVLYIKKTVNKGFVPNIFVSQIYWSKEMKPEPKGISKLLNKHVNFTLLILDEWLLDSMNEEEIHFIFELIERRYDESAIIYCTQFMKKDWHQRLDGVHADAIMDRIVHNAVWFNTGDKNIREYEAKNKTSEKWPLRWPIFIRWTLYEYYRTPN